MSKDKATNQKDTKKFIILVFIIVVLLVITILLIPHIKQLMIEENRNALIEYIRSKGVWGVLILLALQLLQVIVAFIPGEVVEVAAGVLYGTFGGYLICTLGVVISSVVIFYTVRKLGSSFVNRMVPQDKMKKLAFLYDTKKLEVFVFILFFIPGTPKDLLTYFVPLTAMKPLSFFVISTLARIPSILSSTYAGSTIDKGNFQMTILIFAITGILGILGIVYHDKIIGFLHRHEKE